MKIPKSKRRKALILVDVQSAFVMKRNNYAIKNIKKLLKNINYNLYIESLFHAEKGSIWDKETNYSLPKNKGLYTIKDVKELLDNKRVIKIEKNTKSVFESREDVAKILKENKINEVHIIGFQTNDCVLATAYSAFDKGFFTYVIEECCEADSLKEHKLGLKVLRVQCITNNSLVENIPFVRI